MKDTVFATVVVIVGALGALVAWLHLTFSPTYALAGIILLGSGFFIVVGVLLAASIQKATLGAVSDFAERDAKTDRYRQQAFKELMRGQSAWDKAEAQMRVIEAKRVDKLADQRAKLITDAERERWEVRQQAEKKSADSFGWDDSEAFNGW
jgi:hypothetical protein